MWRGELLASALATPGDLEPVVESKLLDPEVLYDRLIVVKTEPAWRGARQAARVA